MLGREDSDHSNDTAYVPSMKQSFCCPGNRGAFKHHRLSIDVPDASLAMTELLRKRVGSSQMAQCCCSCPLQGPQQHSVQGWRRLSTSGAAKAEQAGSQASQAVRAVQSGGKGAASAAYRSLPDQVSTMITLL